MNLTYDYLKKISEVYGDTFYLLDSAKFLNNYKEMLSAFRLFYKNTHIAYSYKTNYVPKLCKLIEENGGYAEIVSEMEMWIALQNGVEPFNIYYNGPYKKKEYIEKLMLLGGNINIDSCYEIDIISNVARKYPDRKFAVGVRCNIDIGQEQISRFGIDDDNLIEVIKKLNIIDNVKVRGLHCHLPFRSLDSYKKRMEEVMRIINRFPNYRWDYISLGGGYMGKIDEEFSKSFSFVPPSFQAYAQVIAGGFERIFGNKQGSPKLIIEPGSALVADTMQLVTRVIDIKHIKNKYIAIMSGSTYNMNPSVKEISRPIQVYAGVEDGQEYDMLDMAGYTCIESDYLYKGYTGKLNAGDFVVFKNVGSYSVVMKPPFILPDIAIIDIDIENRMKLIKKKQTPEAIFMDFLE